MSRWIGRRRVVGCGFGALESIQPLEVSRRPRVLEADTVELGLDQQQSLTYLVGFEAQLRRCTVHTMPVKGCELCKLHSSVIA